MLFSVGWFRLVINRGYILLPRAVQKRYFNKPSELEIKIITSKNSEKNLAEISTCARKRGKNVKIGHIDPGIENAGSTGRQHVHGHQIRVSHAFLHLQLRGFVKI